MKEGNSLLPVPEGFKIKIVHLFKPEQLKEEAMFVKKPPRYVTYAMLIDTSDNKVVAMAGAFCSPRDTPSRKLGRRIAHNRCLKEWSRYGNVEEALRLCG